jgi:hypothetical protein
LLKFVPTDERYPGVMSREFLSKVESAAPFLIRYEDGSLLPPLGGEENSFDLMYFPPMVGRAKRWGFSKVFERVNETRHRRLLDTRWLKQTIFGSPKKLLIKDFGNSHVDQGK